MHVGVRAFELNARLTRFVKTRRALELVTFVASSPTNARVTIGTSKTNFVRRFNPLSYDEAESKVIVIDILYGQWLDSGDLRPKYFRLILLVDVVGCAS